MHPNFSPYAWLSHSLLSLFQWPNRLGLFAVLSLCSNAAPGAVTSQILGELPPERFRIIPKAGYPSIKFCRSLFQQLTPRFGSINRITFLELPAIGDSLRLCDETALLISQAMDGLLQPDPAPLREAMAILGV
ncbi:hypothetical protein Q1695_015549 [Nippostrongylus brasiliensis]|nr:hypothetical protein Q1695_015549 [Nippostrongylus brasiliensis]